MRFGFLLGPPRETRHGHVFALGVLGALAPTLLTGFFLDQTIQSNQERLAAIRGVAHHEARLEVLRKNSGFGHAVVSKVLVRARSGYSGAHLITNVALSNERRVTRSYEGSVLTMGDDGRYIGLNGHSIDGMDRQELLRELHGFGKHFLDQNR